MLGIRRELRLLRDAMSNCECPIAGYCERHKVTKTEHWHKLCQRDDYFTAWEEGRGPGQSPPAEVTDARRERIARNVATRQRLIGWLKLFRLPTDQGIGDTANRLRLQRRKGKPGVVSDAHESIKRLLSQCSCSKTEAVARLNREWPY